MVINPISYPGNKAKIISKLIPEFSNKEKYFVDVFCGSGIVGVNSLQKRLVLNDKCSQVVDILKFFYTNSLEKIVSSIEDIIYKYNFTYTRVQGKYNYIEHKHEGLSLYNKNQFNKLKNDYNTKPETEKLIVLLIYGFNHYIRFNKKGFFNIPVGKVDFSESIYNNLIKFINEIKKKNITFSNLDFRDKKNYIYRDAIYYFDPPYLITNAPYNNDWKEKEENDLLEILDNLNKKKIKFALSNVIYSKGLSNDLLDKWSKKYNIVYMGRQYKNSNYQKKNKSETKEVLIKNF